MAAVCVHKLLSSKGINCSLLRPTQIFLLMLREKSTVILGEVNKKGTDEEIKGPTVGEKLNYLVHNFVPETKKLVEEYKIAITSNPMLEAEHGNYETLFRFNDKASIDDWIVTADRDNNQGKSSASFVLSQNRTGLFRGNICNEVPQDGEQKYAGYVNITSPKPLKSFNRESNWDWSLYNCLLMKVRGDGRAYMIVIGCNFYYDVNWLNRWSCPLFTRGGPYWQVAKIPFSKFFFSSHGRIQDVQEQFPLGLVNSIGITLAHSAEGPFGLEIDNIALMYDVNLSGKLVYDLHHDVNRLAQT